MATILMTVAEKKAPSKYEWLINFLTLGRRGKIYRYIRQKYLQENQLLLDAGCGTGRFLEIADISWTIPIGIDISESMLQQARKRFVGRKRPPPPLIRSSITALPVKSELFDIIISTLVLSELVYQDIQKALEEFYSCLKKDGLLIIVTESKPESKINHFVISLLRFPAYIIAALIAKVPRHFIYDMVTLLSAYGPILDQKSYLGGYLTLFVIKKNG